MIMQCCITDLTHKNNLTTHTGVVCRDWNISMNTINRSPLKAVVVSVVVGGGRCCLDPFVCPLVHLYVCGSPETDCMLTVIIAEVSSGSSKP